MVNEAYLDHTLRSEGERQFTLQGMQAVSANAALFGGLFGLVGIEFILWWHQAKEDRQRMIRLLMEQAGREDVHVDIRAASVHLAKELSEGGESR